MKDRLQALWDKFNAGQLTHQELLEAIKLEVGEQEFPPVVINSESPEWKLEIIIDEDNVVFSVGISEETGEVFEGLGVERV